MFMMGGGMNPAEMMVGMAVGGVVGRQMSDIMNSTMQDMQQRAATAGAAPAVVPPAALPVAPPPPNQQYHKENSMHVYDESNFYSLNRLMEFGMTTSVAQQMVNSMNHGIDNMRIPGAGNPMHPPQQTTLKNTEQEKHETQKPPDTLYFAMIDGEQTGPFCETELGRLINYKKVCRDTYIWHTGLKDWTTAENIPAVLRLVALVPPPPPQGI